jgi:hypothetical protein
MWASVRKCHASCLTVDPEHPTTVYVAIDRSVFISTDAGGSWQRITHGLPRGVVTSLAVDPQRSGTVYAGLQTVNHTGGIYKTTNGGRTWSRAIISGAAIDTLALDPARPATIYAAGWAGSDRTQHISILRSTNGGHTWATAP